MRHKNIYIKCAFKIRNPGYPGLGVPISYSFCLRWCCSHKNGNQETKGVDFVFQNLGAKPLQRKPRNESTEGFEPAALSIPAHVLIHSGMASFRPPKRHHINPMVSAACNQPLPEPPKIRNRAPQFLKFKKTSPSISYFGGFSYMAKLILSPY